MDALEVRRLRKIYRDGTVGIEDISLRVEEGALIAVLGPNGAGKTTLLRQLSTELLPSSGEIRILGIDAVRFPAKVKPLLGVIPQEAAPFPYLTPSEHLRWFGSLKGLSTREAEIQTQQLLDQLGLEEYRNRLTATLSGGLKRRVLLGIAFAGRPRVILLDEPTLGLDPAARREVWEIIRQKLREGVTVLLTTHYLEEAEALAQHVTIINRGRIIVEGTPQELIARSGKQMRLIIKPSPVLGMADIQNRLYGLGDLDMTVLDGQVVIYLSQIDTRLTTILRLALESNLEISITPVGLEEAYLRLIGG